MDRKEYLKDYYQAHAEDIKRKRREHYALQKAQGTRFREADLSLEQKDLKIHKLRADKLAGKTFKDIFHRNPPDNLVVVTQDFWEEPLNNVIVPAELVTKDCTVACFNKSLTLVGFIEQSRLKPYYDNFMVKKYVVPTREYSWFDVDS